MLGMDDGRRAVRWLPTRPCQGEGGYTHTHTHTQCQPSQPAEEPLACRGSQINSAPAFPAHLAAFCAAAQLVRTLTRSGSGCADQPCHPWKIPDQDLARQTTPLTSRHRHRHPPPHHPHAHFVTALHHGVRERPARLRRCALPCWLHAALC
jgi:hypothetical protein